MNLRASLEGIPMLYETEGIELDNKEIYAHFFIGGCDWWIVEYDGEDIAFGYANLNDSQNAEWGYISVKELEDIRVHGFEIEADLYWTVKKFKEIEVD